MKFIIKLFFFRNDSYIDENVRNANLFLPYIQKNKLLIILIHGFTEDINSYDIGILTSSKLSIRLITAYIKYYLYTFAIYTIIYMQLHTLYTYNYIHIYSVYIALYIYNHNCYNVLSIYN